MTEIPVDALEAPANSLCQEASPRSRDTYIPCNAPAIFVVQGADPCSYTMCAMCADHNVRNRSAHYVRAGEAHKPYLPPVPLQHAAPQFNISQVQKIYLETKDAVETLSKRHQEEMDPLSKRLELCKSWMLDYLNKQGLDNVKTENGMCYKSNIMQATVDPEDGWSKFLTYIFEKAITRVLDRIEAGDQQPEAMQTFLSEPALALLNRSVNKTAVKELLDQGTSVPGVKIATVTTLNARRS